jgi:hypothetical protein
MQWYAAGVQRVGVITDIHANLPALEAALARIDDLGVDGLYCGSDGNPRAAFALLEADGDGVRVSIESVAYDAAAVAREVATAGLPTEYAEKLVLAA